VGYANRQQYHRDTVNKSFEAAIFSIIQELSATVQNRTENRQGPGAYAYGSSSEHTIRAQGALSGFYVLDTWLDSSNMTVYTLAIARANEEQGAILE
jgi:hypothetical protein